MKHMLLSLLFIPILLSGCNLVSDYGSTSAGDVKGYKTYTNHTLGISLLVPGRWNKEMTIGGSYNMNPAQNNSYDGVSASSYKLADLFEGKLSANASLDDFQRLARDNWYDAASIGPDYESSWEKTTLSGKPAWEVTYAYTPEGDDRRLVREIFTVHNGKVYFLRWYAKAANKDRYAREFATIRDSFKIID